MQVELRRDTKTGNRTIRLVSDDTVMKPETLDHWIKMLRSAKAFLEGGKKHPKDVGE